MFAKPHYSIIILTFTNSVIACIAQFLLQNQCSHKSHCKARTKLLVLISLLHSAQGSLSSSESDCNRLKLLLHPFFPSSLPSLGVGFKFSRHGLSLNYDFHENRQFTGNIINLIILGNTNITQMHRLFII